MYGYYFNFNTILTFLVIIFIAALVAWLMAINLFANIAKEKGYFENGAGILWFIGIFATPIVVGLYVNALPDKSNRSTKDGKHTATNDELPSI